MEPENQALHPITLHATQSGYDYDNYTHWPLENLLSYILDKEETLLKLTLPSLKHAIDKYHQGNGKNPSPAHRVSAFCGNIEEIINFDKKQLFPYIFNLIQSCEKQTEISVPAFSSLWCIRTQKFEEYTRLSTEIDYTVELYLETGRTLSELSARKCPLHCLNSLRQEFNTISRLKFQLLYEKAMDLESRVGRRISP